jgi:hypothetical protein
VTTRTDPFRVERMERRCAALALLVLIACAIYTRIPPILNADGLNSDVAVVGLQARQIRAGFWQPFLPGSGYQTSTDSTWAAIVFLVFGDSSRSLYGSAVFLHLVLLTAAFFWLRGTKVNCIVALVLCLPLAMTTASANSYAIYPPREASLALGFLALATGGWALSSRALGALSGLLLGFALYADPYARLLVPMWLVQRALHWRERRLAFVGEPMSIGGSTERYATRWFGFELAAFVFALLPSVLLSLRKDASRGQASLVLSVFRHNLDLFWSTCAPWAFGSTTYHAPIGSTYVPWTAPPLFRALGFLGVIAMVTLSLYAHVCVVHDIVGALRARRLVKATTRVALVAAVGFWSTIFGFMVSPMVMDHFSMRYLALATLCLPLMWLAAFSLPSSPKKAQMVARRQGGLLLVAIVPMLSMAISGWVSHDPYTRGILPIGVEDSGDEQRLFAKLKAASVTNASADYWVSYRLTFLASGELRVVPNNEQEDRIPRDRAAWRAAQRVAYVWEEGRSRENIEKAASYAAEEGTVLEQWSAGRYRVWILERSRQ